MSQRSEQTKRAFVSRAGWFSLFYPVDWELEEGEDVALYNPQGVGSLHVSAYEAPELVNPRTELLEQLSEHNPSARLDDIETWTEGDKTIASFESFDDQSFQKVWFVARDSYLLIATYHCDLEDRDTERSDIEEIVRSMQIRPKFGRN